jgi:hypothetical protein
VDGVSGGRGEASAVAAQKWMRLEGNWLPHEILQLALPKPSQLRLTKVNKGLTTMATA